MTDSPSKSSFLGIPVDISTKTDSNQTFSLVHNSIDRFLKEYNKSLPNIKIHDGRCAQTGSIAEQHIKDLQSTNNRHIGQYEDQGNAFGVYQIGLYTEQEKKEGEKMSKMDTDIFDQLSNRDTHARKRFDNGKPMPTSISEYRIDNVSSITEKEFNSIRENPSSFLNEGSFSPSCQEGLSVIETNQQKVSSSSDKNKSFHKSPENSYLSQTTNILQQSQTMFDDNTSVKSMLSNASSCQESNTVNTEENSQKSERYSLLQNDDVCSRFDKSFRSKSTTEVIDSPTTTSTVDQNFPYLNRNTLIFDKNGKSIQRFIVRSDGIICPVKQVSAFSVVPQKSTITQQNTPKLIALDTNSSTDKFRRKKETIEEEYNKRRRIDAQRYTVLPPRNGVIEKHPPLQPDKLALQAHAFKKFQYMLALKFRRYFLREYERSRHFYGTENKRNVRSESQTFGKLDITKRSTIPNQSYGDIESNIMDGGQYTQHQLLNDSGKRNGDFGNDGGLNSYFQQVNYVNHGVESGQLSTSGVLKMSPNNAGCSYDGTQNDSALNSETSDFWRNRIRHAGSRNSYIDNMDEFIDRSARGLNRGTANTINATHFEYPIDSHARQSHTDGQPRLTTVTNDIHHGYIQVENPSETSRRKEIFADDHPRLTMNGNHHGYLRVENPNENFLGRKDSFTHDQHQLTMNDIHYGHKPVENPTATLSGRKEFAIAQNIDSYQVGNSFQDTTTDNHFTCNSLSNPLYEAQGQSAFRYTHPFNDTAMFQIERTERVHPQWRLDSQFQSTKAAEMNYPHSQQHSAKFSASYTTDIVHNRGNSSLAMSLDPQSNQRPDTIFSYNESKSQAKETYPVNLSQRF